MTNAERGAAPVGLNAGGLIATRVIVPDRLNREKFSGCEGRCMGRPPPPIKMVTPYAIGLSLCLYKPEQKFRLLYVFVYPSGHRSQHQFHSARRRGDRIGLPCCDC